MKRKITAIESRKPTSTKPNWLVLLIIAVVALGAFGTGMSLLEESANEEMLARKNRNYQPTLLGRVNPFLPDPTPTPTPRLSKEYIYAGTRLLAVEDADANAAPPADLAVWRRDTAANTGTWWVLGGSGAVAGQWGLAGDVPVPGDYDGDGRTDFSVFRPSAGTWWIFKSSDGNSYTETFGATGDLTAPADYDGDGKTDVAVFRSSNATWYIRHSSTGSTVSTQYGGSGDNPAPADYDGDGRADIALWRNSNTTFHIVASSNGNSSNTSFGSSGDQPVCGDYDGDGKADIALWRSGNATWYILRSTDNSTESLQYGVATDTPVRNDYDADGRADIAVWRGVESSPGAGDVGKWYIRKSSDGNTRTETWGIAGDIPVPAFYRR